MRTHEQQLNYERLELISSANPRFNLNAKKVASRFQAFWNGLVGFFALGSEPHIYQTSDASGQWWYVYDPTTGASAWFTSENEVLAWLDSRYHRRGTLLND